MIQAITNVQIGLKYDSSTLILHPTYDYSSFSVIAELLIGYLRPGRPIAMMM
jgi:hypothetical protein